MNFLTTALIILSVIVMCFAVLYVFINEISDGLTVEASAYITNYFLFAIFLLLLSFAIKYVW